MTNTPQSENVDGTANGTCSGTLTDADSAPRQIRAVTATLSTQSHGTEACELGRGTGSGQLTIDGQMLAFSYSEVRAGPVLTLTARGASPPPARSRGAPQADGDQ